MKNKLIVILIGPPGSGKGTQAKLLQEKFALKYIGSGDLLRARKTARDFTGIKIAQCIDGGKRIPTPIIFALWMEKMEEFKRTDSMLNGFILDGSPRTIFEAEMLEWTFDWFEWNKNKKIFFIKLSPAEIVKRLSKRRMCKKCGQLIPCIGDLEFIKVCNKCEGELIVRPDDTVQGVKERLAWFKTDVMPAIKYYKKQGLLIEINGGQSIKDVFQDILKEIGQDDNN